MALTPGTPSQTFSAAALAADVEPRRAPGYARFAWGVLAFNLLVVLWGAYVRASGSGAGCGSHWPLCNGEVVPRSPAVATLIEFGHRTTSGIALLLVAALVIGAWRRFPPRHAARLASACAAFFLITEALIGAGLVLLELVAQNASVARGYWVAGHLVNTFLLIAALTLTAWWAAAPPGRLRREAKPIIFAVAAASLIVLGVSGAVTALGDTLFPAASLAEAETQTFAESAHVFIRLRIWHPALALATGAFLAFTAFSAVTHAPRRAVRRLAVGLVALFLLQLGVGLANVWLLAPIGMQLVHLFLSHLIWITLVLLSANALAPAVPTNLRRVDRPPKTPQSSRISIPSP